ncbi:MAG: radical SAM/SPASM domain-containing protein, partial [Candidatus Thorarchaeota archaeon]
GMMAPEDYYKVIHDAVDHGVQSVKLNYRGEPTLHPHIDEFVHKAAFEGFIDIMMNTNGNGGARKNPEIFATIVKNGITNLMFSVDACSSSIYTKQRVNGEWLLLLNSVRSAVLARDMGLGHPDCRIRVSAVRTKWNADQIDSGDFEKFWVDDIGVDWVSISECYFPAGVQHDWRAASWAQMFPSEFQCADPFRRMVVTWDLESTLPCCQGYTKAINGGEVRTRSIADAWNSPEFNELRSKHRNHTWDYVPMCNDCPLTKKIVEDGNE